VSPRTNAFVHTYNGYKEAAAAHTIFTTRDLLSCKSEAPEITANRKGMLYHVREVLGTEKTPGGAQTPREPFVML
jgi:hypothetical protein